MSTDSTVDDVADYMQQIPDIEAEEEFPSFCIESSDRLGRFMVATRDLFRGEVILQETPLATAPQKNSPVICPGCFKSPEEQCGACGWPICSSECPEISKHLAVECVLLSKRTKTASLSEEEVDWSEIQDSLMILRCLSLRTSNKEKWEQFMEMETNWEQWSKSPLLSNAKEVASRLKNEYALKESEDEILKVQAILDINAYEVKMPDCNIQGCYKLASLAEHSCVPNALKTTSSETLLLTLLAIRDIKKGEHISTTYCDVLWPTTKRQRYMQWSKFFICQCQRCEDSTELNSFIGALECPHCLDGALVPLLHPLETEDIEEQDEDGESGEGRIWANSEKDYHCHKCSARFACKGVESFVVNAENQLHEMDELLAENTEEGIFGLEEWLEQWTRPQLTKHSSPDELRVFAKRPITPREKRVGCSSSSLVFLHPHHSLCLDAYHTLFLNYSKDNATLQTMRRKDQLGTLLLLATKTLFSGISMFRGTVMYELGLTKAAILAKYLDSPREESAGEDLTTWAKEVLWLLTEALDHLTFESPDQPEGILFTLGIKQLEEFREFLSPMIQPEPEPEPIDDVDELSEPIEDIEESTTPDDL